MAAAALIFSILAMGCAFYRREAAVRESILFAGVTFGVILTLVTELLSLFHALMFWALFISWILIAITAGAVALIIPPMSRRPLSGWRSSIGECSTVAVFRVAAPVITGISALTALIGLLSAPSNWDSMTYHLARVMHWMQNASVDHFPSNYHPQLYHGPFAEFVILHLQILTQGDRLAFGVQWASMIGCIGVASLIAKRLDANVAGQMLTAIFIVTLPMGILQAQSTQNSYVLSFFILGAIEAVFRLRQTEEKHWFGPTLLAGSCFGLALLTKGTAFAIAAPIGLWWLLEVSKKPRWVRLRCITVLLLIVAVLNGSHMARNIGVFHSPLIPSAEAGSYRVDSMTPALLASNVFRHLALQIWLPTRSCAAGLQSLINHLYTQLLVDPNDPRITCSGHAFVLRRSIIDEDVSGSPFHFAVMLAAAAIAARRVIRQRPSPTDRDQLLLLGNALIGFVLFCSTIKWMWYNVRLELPFFLIAAAPTATIIAKVIKPRGVELLAIALSLLAIPYVVANPGHPLFGRHSIFLHSREEQYFVNNPSLLTSYQSAMTIITDRHASPIGFAADGGWEYPIWVMYKARTGQWPHVVDVPGTAFPRDSIDPSAQGLQSIICVGGDLTASVFKSRNGAIKSFGAIHVILPLRPLP